jgi:ubiquinone/menaquinone biosynthesis C-methylase UbiE
MSLKSQISYLAGKTSGSASFIRIIEWREILRLSHLQNGIKILDVACGDGALSLKIAKKGYEAHGIDMSIYSIKRAKCLGCKRDCHFVVADAEQLPYKNKSFDRIVCSSSLEHFSNDVKALKEMNRVLKPNGIVVLTTDSSSYPMEETLRSKYRSRFNVVNYYNSEEVSHRFERSGFKLLSNKYLINSVLTTFFYRLFVKTRGNFYHHLLVLLLGNLLLPLFLISDKLAGREDRGYTLLASGEKE